MPHPAGERRHCEECGAEILYTKACNCPERDPKVHQDICCGKEMVMGPAPESAQAGHPGGA